jgi:predicted adenylyl cyclase CyaB
MSKPQIEIELRSLFDQKKHDEHKQFLNKNAQDLGEDDKDVYFYLLPNKVFKVVNNISQNSAKIVLKLSRVGRGRSEAEEIEIPIETKYFDKACRLFSYLKFKETQRSFQKRHNYLYKGVELALKYSNSWGHHLELEIVVDDLSKKEKAENKIKTIAEELKVTVMTEEEQEKFTRRIDKKYRKGNHKHEPGQPS